MTGECGWQQRKAVISTPFELLDSTVVDQRQPGFLGSVLLLTKGYKSQGSTCVCVRRHAHVGSCAHVCKERIIEIREKTPEKTRQMVCIAVCHKTADVLMNMFCSSVPFRL